EEAMEVADHIVIFNEGRLEQQGSPVDIYRNPATAFISRFMSGGQFLSGTVSEHAIHIGPWVLPNCKRLERGAIEAHLRTDDLLLVADVQAPKAEVRRVHAGHGGYRVQLKVDGVDGLLETAVTSSVSLPTPGDIVPVAVAEDLPIYPQTS